MTTDPAPPAVIDAHTHIFPPEVIAARERFRQRDAWFAALYGEPMARLATAEDLIVAMDRAGVSASVVLSFGWRDGALGRLHNDYLLDAARRYPGRIVPFAHATPDVADPDLDGFAGIGEWMPEGQGFALDEHQRLAGQLDAARERKIPVLSHVSEPVGHAYAGKSNVLPEQFWRLARAFPDNRFIAAHWGGGLFTYELMPEVRRDLLNVVYDTAAGRLLYEPAIFSLALRLLGPQKILWGSDFPLLSPRFDLRAIAQLDLEEEASARLLGENCRSFLGGVARHAALAQ
ncbi:MAG: amidohydrolase family protein [Chloroflexota bacterium]